MDEGEWSGVEVVGETGRNRHEGEGEVRRKGRRRALGRRRRAASLGGALSPASWISGFSLFPATLFFIGRGEIRGISCTSLYSDSEMRPLASLSPLSRGVVGGDIWHEWAVSELV